MTKEGSAISIFWAYVRFRVLVWALRMTGRLLLWSAVAAVLVAVAPLTLVTALGVFGILPLAFNMFFILLELLVAVLQAYVFTILTCIYLHDAIHLH